MKIETPPMRWIVVAMVASACTTPNPRSCEDGTCTDPAYPFCDGDGSLQGQPKTCIAVTCTPGEVAQCRGDVAVTCNAEGTSYDTTQCERGCDATIAGGCRLCEPSQTVCANGAVQTCDATGTVVSSATCPLGCFETEPRCREIEPSNSLAMYFDMVAAPPDLDLSAGGTITPYDGVVKDVSGAALDVPSFIVNGDPQGVPIRILVAKRVRLGNVNISLSLQPGSVGLAVLATDDITVEGKVNVVAGGVNLASCKGGVGYSGAASGGGGHATAGAAGGGIATIGGSGGGVSGTATLVPLRGGCASGPTVDMGVPPPSLIGSPGGGAIQLTSKTSISVLDTGIIDANGFSGSNYDNGPPAVPWGGGGGGGILLEAPHVSLTANARVVANGGPGAPGDAETGDMFPESVSLAPASGPPCFHPSSSCGSGGAGGAVGVDATAGGIVNGGNPGSGGGGLGRIRINTKDATYEKTNTSVEAGSLTTGVVGTR